MRAPRGLTREEAELWARVTGTIRPLPGKSANMGMVNSGREGAPSGKLAKPAVKLQPKPPGPRALAPSKPRQQALDQHGLDGTWEKKLARGGLEPDFTLDLHGYNLESAHARLDHGLTMAAAMQARVVLIITGKPRPVEAADRSDQRGAIRAKLIDWLAAGSHASRIAAVRRAHRRHGAAGAVYVVLKRLR